MTHFHQLSPGIQRWLYQQGWSSLRPIQEKAIPVVLDADRDVLITAPTAAGKTEAAFLPVLSSTESDQTGTGFRVLVVSPLKALINDQHKRLSTMCHACNLKITSWHGDIPANTKKKAWQTPSGLLMITPESLEGLLLTRQSQLKDRLGGLLYVVIDELHAFLGKERGYQLISLLTRLDYALGTVTPRIGLSATIGDPEAALRWLRPNSEIPGQHLAAEETKRQLQISLSTFKFPAKHRRKDPSVGEQMADYLWQRIRGKTNLIFANARGAVEELADDFNYLVESECLPAEVFPHHGSLSKEFRHDVEQRLKCDRRPATAVATCTLELGIDIGNVHSVSQVCAPASASSLKQRLGRSGRREGAPAILRMLLSELSSHPKAHYIFNFEVQLVQTISVLDLLLEKWIEPTGDPELDMSTLVQQALAFIVQQNGANAAEIYHVLCKKGPFRAVTPDLFGKVLRGLGAHKIIQQLQTGELIIGANGERVVSSHQFLAAFESVEEYQVIHNSKSLGTLPTSMMILPGQPLLFAGGRWLVSQIDNETKSVLVQPHHKGEVPPYEGETAPVHPLIRQRMREIYAGDHFPAYCSTEAADLLHDVRIFYSVAGLEEKTFFSKDGMYYLFVWCSDQIIETIARVLLALELEVTVFGPVIIFDEFCHDTELLQRILADLKRTSALSIAREVASPILGKFDVLLPPELVHAEYGRRRLDVDGAIAYLEQEINRR